MTKVRIKVAKPKKIKRKTLKNKCDRMYREIVHTRGSCEMCGYSQGVLNCHHVVGRNNHSLRWDIRNSCLLCVKCHYQAHENILSFAAWFKAYRTSDYHYLMQKKNEVWDLDYDKVLDYLATIRQ